MSFKLGKTNNFVCEVPCTTPVDDQMVDWKFKAEFKILTDEDVKAGKGNILKDALLRVFDVPAEDGLAAAEILQMCRSRPDTSNALVKAYNENVVKKNRGSSLF